MRRWQDHTMIETKLARLHNRAKETSPTLISEVAKYGAIESLSRMVKSIAFRTLKDSFDRVKIYSWTFKTEQTKGKDSVEKIELIKRQQVLM